MERRTDEGVCPYFEASFWIERTIPTRSRLDILPLGEAGWGFQTRASVPTLWRCFDARLVVAGNEESLFLLASINHFS